MEILEHQLKLIRADSRKRSKCEYKELRGQFQWIAEEPCKWNIVRFTPANAEEWEQWMANEEFMNTGKGKLLIQMKERLFYFKGQWDDEEMLSTCPQDDYQLARFKQCVETLKNDQNWSWMVSKFLKGSNQRTSVKIEDNKKIPSFKKGSLNIIVGTPGAGKSTFCAEFVKSKVDKYKILYVAPAHTNVNGFLRKLIQMDVKDVSVLSDEAKLATELRSYHNSNMKSFNPSKKNLILPDKQITVSTVNKPIKSPKESGIQIIIIDEATRVSLIEVMTLIYRFNGLLCVVLAGDPKQLGARIGQNEAKDAMRFTLQQGEARIWNLFRQYRFGRGINDVISPLYYQNQMVAATNRKSSMNWIIINKCECDQEEKIGCNTEVKVALAVYRLLSGNDKIVLTPYKLQLRKFQEKESNINIKTIDTSQGDEYDHVVVSFGRHQGRGFITRERINVGLSRARRSVHVILNARVVEKIPAIKRTIDISKEKGLVNYI